MDTPMPGVRVRVTRAGADKASGITGPKGTVTFQGIELGEVRVLSEREGYVRKPESTDTTVRAGANSLRVTLLAEGRDGEYFRKAGVSIETEGATLPSEKREAFFQGEWVRVKLLKSESQIPLVLEMKKGREYLSKDGTYQKLMKAGKIIGCLSIAWRRKRCRAWTRPWLRAAGVARVPHDFRTTAIRNLERDGVPRSVAMAMVGHKTEEVYRRYAIVDEAMIREAAIKMNRGAKGAAIHWRNPASDRW